MPLKASVAPKLPAGAVRFGVLPASKALTVEVTLNLRNQAELNALLGGLADQSSPYFHRFLTPAQFTAEFGPTAQQVSDVETALRAAGLTPGQVSSDNLSIPVTATASQLEHAFGTTLATYRVSGGRVAYANTTAPEIPSAVASIVQGVIGLNNLYPVHSAAQPTPGSFVKASAGAGTSPAVAGASGPKACSIISHVPDSVSMTTLANFYGLNSLYALNDLGAGARVAILELEPNVHSDIATFEQCYGIHTGVFYHEIDGGGTGDPNQSIETPLDIETVAALAPNVAIDVYQGPNSDGGGPGTGFYDIFKAFVTANTDKVLSVSWGECEAFASLSDMQAQEALFEQANAQGQTILAAAGDNGSTDCYNPPTSTDSTLSPNEPASLPFVVSVGGTKVNVSGHSEITWNESGQQAGAGGGGISNFDDGAAPGTDGWCMPAYQHQTAIPGIVNSHSKPAASCPTGFLRESPDISADADPFTGYAIFVALGGNGGWGSVGGTSGATPLWAAIAALTDVSPFCSGYGSGNAGVLPQALYAAVAGAHTYVYGTTAEALYDVKSGNNDYRPSGYTGGLYPAAGEYDIATGLGTPVVGGRTSSGAASNYFPGYTALICRQLATRHLSVSSVGPNFVKQNTAIKVTIHGTGFLAVPGADLVKVFQGTTKLATLTASCTTTACTVTLPAESARTVSLEVSVEDGPNSQPLSFIYTAASHITSISPTSGSHAGGNTVTIKGTWFVGVKSVTFNGKAGHAVVTSPTTLTVTVPPGTAGATVKVVVTNVTGASNSVNYKYT